MQNKIVLLLLVAMFFPSISATASEPLDMLTDFSRITDLGPGKKGYGLSVFKGIEPEKFDIEILDVVPGPGPGSASILATVTDSARNGSQKTFIGQGFSGSPVYVDGRLIGALSYMETNQAGTVFGIRPISEMLLELDRAGIEPDLPELPGNHAVINPGQMISIPLIRGDICQEYQGTVTLVQGKQLLLLGHDIDSWGDKIILPLHRSRVATVMAKRDMHHKIGTAEEEIGVVTWDGKSGAVGWLGRKAPMLPVRVEYRNGEERDTPYAYSLEMVPAPHVFPSLMSSSLLTLIGRHYYQSIESGETISLNYTITDVTGGIMQFSQRFDTATDGKKDLEAPWKAFCQVMDMQRINRLDIVCTKIAGHRRAIIDQVEFAKTSVKPGQTVELVVRLIDENGETHQEFFAIPVPESFIGNSFPVSVVSGDKVVPGAGRPEEDPYKWFNNLLRNDDLVILYPAERRAAANGRIEMLARTSRRMPWRLENNVATAIAVRE